MDAATAMSWEDFKVLIIEEFCPDNEMQKLETQFWNHAMVGSGHATYTDKFHDLARLVPHLVTPEPKRIARYINGLVPQIRGMVKATEPTTLQSAIQKAGALTDEAVSCGLLPKNGEKRKEDGESSKHGGSWAGNKRAKTGKGFVAAKPVTTDNQVRRGYTGNLPKCDKCTYHHSPQNQCRVCFNCNGVGHFAKDCRAVNRHVTPVNAVNMGNNGRFCYECGDPGHFRSTCPKLNRAPGQAGNRLAIGGNQEQGNAKNQPRGRVFIMGANEARQDPNIVTGTFSLNNHYATVLFDSGADFSFISTEFANMLNVESSVLKPSYIIEVANGKEIEVNRIIRGCTLLLEDTPFTIDLIPFGHGSFDVIVGMDWLSKHKAAIICHEKVVRIPLTNGYFLHVLGERTKENPKSLMSVKTSELKDIVVVQNFPEVFPDDLSGLPPK